MSRFQDPNAAPSRELLFMEVRAFWEFGALLAAYPLLRLAPRGDGHPVLVVPGLGAGDGTTRALRRFLRDQGWSPHGWGLGPNRGPRPGVEARMQSRLAELAERYGRKVSLIGWSLGGIFAREMARRAPQQVRQVITLGSPFAGAPKASNAWQLYEHLSGRKVEDWPDREGMKQPPPVPTTAIYSKSDGIVAWQGCLEREGLRSENIEVAASHCGLGHHPAVLHAVADRLSQPEGAWRRFEPRGVAAALYPSAGRAFAPA